VLARQHVTSLKQHNAALWRGAQRAAGAGAAVQGGVGLRGRPAQVLLPAVKGRQTQVAASEEAGAKELKLAPVAAEYEHDEVIVCTDAGTRTSEV
jgi:hypothetical protein